MNQKHFVLFLFCLVSSLAFSSEEIIKRPYYTLNYNEEHEVANWVSYELDHHKIQNCVKRTNSFKIDPLISTGSANSEDYRGSGFDRGHLVPAGDMKFNASAMSDTFYFSNMTPQPSKFNQTRWGQLENLMRAWALKYKKIWIVTGPILEENLPVIGNQNEVSIPKLYFKAILRQTSAKTYEGIAFLMSTDIPHSELSGYVSTINEVENLTGHDFFKFLDDRTEERIEETSDLSNWDFKARFDYLPCRTLEFQ